MCWHCLPFMKCPLVANTNARQSIKYDVKLLLINFLTIILQNLLTLGSRCQIVQILYKVSNMFVFILGGESAGGEPAGGESPQHQSKHYFVKHNCQTFFNVMNFGMSLILLCYLEVSSLCQEVQIVWIGQALDKFQLNLEPQSFFLLKVCVHDACGSLLLLLPHHLLQLEWVLNHYSWRWLWLKKSWRRWRNSMVRADR